MGAACLTNGDVGALSKAETTMTSALVVMATVAITTTLANQQLHKPEHFKIGFLAPWNTSVDDFSALTSASAISIALERIHSDPTLNRSMRFRSVLLSQRTCTSRDAVWFITSNEEGCRLC